RRVAQHDISLALLLDGDRLERPNPGFIHGNVPPSLTLEVDPTLRSRSARSKSFTINQDPQGCAGHARAVTEILMHHAG
ncbi:MAG: hypothetical protein ACREQC_06170, partial [Candidatus Binataceae bacterium]